MALSPQEAAKLADALDDLVSEAKAVRRRCNVLVTMGARLRDQLRNLQSEEDTRNDRDRNTR